MGTLFITFDPRWLKSALGAFWGGSRSEPDEGNCLSKVIPKSLSCIGRLIPGGFGGALGRLWEPLGRLWEPLGRLWGGFGKALGGFGEPLGRLWEALGSEREQERKTTLTKRNHSLSLSLSLYIYI